MLEGKFTRAAKGGALAGGAGAGIPAPSAGIAWQRSARRALPLTSGTLNVPGLAAPVTVRRDRWGTPHLEAGSLEDMLFGEGFVHAQDRLWQMDFYRRVTAGR